MAKRTMKKNRSHSFSTGEAIKFGWEALKRNYLIFLTIFIIEIIMYVIHSVINMQLGDKNSAGLLIVSVIFYIIGAIISLGMYNVLLLLVKEKKTSANDLFSVISLTPQFIISSILETLLVIVGFILLIIPGIIWCLKFQFFPYIIIEKQVGPIEALKRSAAITKGNLWNLFGFGAALLLLNILGVICLFVGLLITIPVTMVASAYVYKKLSA